MLPAAPPPSCPKALLASARDYDAAADLTMVRRVGALTWILVALLGLAMLAVWPPHHGPLALRLADEAGLVTLVPLALLCLRLSRLTLPGALAGSLWSIVLLGVLQACSVPSAHFVMLIAFPIVFVAASQAPLRVALALLVGILSDLAALLAYPVSATSAAASAAYVVLWTCLAGMALVWNAGVRWQRLELRHQRRTAEALSLHDPLTGLGNRRKLTLYLDEILASGQEALLAMFDLNGFKAYNDSFGHPAGDGLLARLADSLQREAQGLAEAFRMGGDEFCLLARGPSSSTLDLVGLGRNALREGGHGFVITAAGGAAALPGEATQAVDALKLADRRMYANKHALRGDAGRDAAEMLLAVLEERDPELADHCKAVAALADRVSARLGIPDPARRHIHRAAQLHDIGKLAIPDSILQKPDALGSEDWGFMRRYPVIGHRIMSACRELGEASELVRLSRERPDGKGYPEGLTVGVPLEARIVAACDAFDAMLRRRPHRPARTTEQALRELRRGAGSEFDARVVEALTSVILRRGEGTGQGRLDFSAASRPGRPA